MTKPIGREVKLDFTPEMAKLNRNWKKTQARRAITLPNGKFDGPDWYSPTCIDEDGNQYPSQYPGQEVFGIWSLDGDWGLESPYWPGHVFLSLGEKYVITNVRVERLREMSEEDAKAEGAKFCSGDGYRCCFIHAWDLTPRADPVKGWDANPWVWVITYRKLEENSERT